MGKKSTDPLVQELERVARQGARAEGRGCVFVHQPLDGTTHMSYFSLAVFMSAPLPGVTDDPNLFNALHGYDLDREYVFIEFVEETDGTTVPTWAICLYRNAKPIASA